MLKDGEKVIDGGIEEGIDKEGGVVFTDAASGGLDAGADAIEDIAVASLLEGEHGFVSQENGDLLALRVDVSTGAKEADDPHDEEDAAMGFAMGGVNFDLGALGNVKD